MTLEKFLNETLTTYDVNTENGVVQINIADALMAIATAITRLAAVQERYEAQREQTRQMVDALREADRSGHA